MMALAVGKKAVSYSPQAGMKSGVDVSKACFGDDLGFTSTYRAFLGYDKEENS